MKIKLNLKYVLFFLAYIMWMAKTILSLSEYTRLMPENFLSAISAVSYSLFIIKIFIFDKYKPRVLLLIMLMTIFLTIFSIKNIQFIDLIQVLIIIIAAKDIEFSDITRKTAYVTIFMIGFIIISALLKIIPFSVSLVGKHYLGFKHYSTPAMLFFNFMGCYLYSKKGDISNFSLILLIFMEGILYVLTSNRLIIVLTFFFLGLYMVFRKRQINKKIWKIISFIVYPICILITFVLAYGYNEYNYFFSFLNHITTGRLALYSQSIKQYHISFLGTYIETNTSQYGGYFYVDSGYLYTYISYGLIVFLFITILYCMFMYYACKTNQIVLYMWLVCNALYNIINNSYTTGFVKNTLLLGFILLIADTKRQDNKNILNVIDMQMGEIK